MVLTVEISQCSSVRRCLPVAVLALLLALGRTGDSGLEVEDVTSDEEQGDATHEDDSIGHICADEDDDQNGSCQAQMSSGTTRPRRYPQERIIPSKKARPAPYWPVKNGNANRTSLSQWIAPFNLKKPSWVWEEPDKKSKPGKPQQVFHSSPILDEEYNTYIVSTTGFMYSLNRTGHVRWSFQFSYTNPGNPALLDGVLYTASMDGIAWAVEAATGKEIWSTRIGMCSPIDTFSALAVGDTVLLPATPMEWMPEAHQADAREPVCGNEDIVALRTNDGSEKWRYSISKRAGTVMYNAMPTLVGNSVIFDDYSGGLFRLSLEDGKEHYYIPGPLVGTWSTGGMLVGPNGKAYVARNKNTSLGANGRDGFVRCHSAKTGRIIWQRKFNTAMNVGLAIGHVKGHPGRLAVIAAPGNNLAPNPIPWWGQALEGFILWLYTPTSFVYALDAATGDIIWELELREPSLQNAGQSRDFTCVPAIFGNPSIDGDGTVYISWSGGKVLAVRDWNGDGKINQKDPKEFSAYKHGWGSNGNVAIGPNYLVVPTCKVILAFEETPS